MAGPHNYPGKPASAYTRCTGCGRLLEKANARRGPAGGTYGKECYDRAVRAHAEDLEAEERRRKEDALDE